MNIKAIFKRENMEGGGGAGLVAIVKIYGLSKALKFKCLCMLTHRGPCSLSNRLLVLSGFIVGGRGGDTDNARVQSSTDQSGLQPMKSQFLTL